LVQLDNFRDLIHILQCATRAPFWQVGLSTQHCQRPKQFKIKNAN